jgi:hypothetical protein
MVKFVSKAATASAIQRPPYLSDPEPDSLKDISRDLLRPLTILGIQGCLTSGDVGIFGSDPLASLENLPEDVKNEENGNTDVGGKEIGHVPVLMVFTYKDIEAVEDNNEGKVDQ